MRYLITLFALFCACFLSAQCEIADNCGNIIGRSWLDENSNGLQDAEEVTPVAAFIELLSPDFMVLESVGTDENGIFRFIELPPNVTFRLRAYIANTDTDLVPTLENQGGDDTVDSDFITTLSETEPFQLFNGEVVETIDVGWASNLCGNGNPLEDIADIVLPCGETTIDVNTIPLDGFMFYWLQDGVVISEAATLENIGPGTYDVIAEHEAEGCGWNRTFTVFSQDIPEVNLVLDDFDFPFCPGTYCLRLDGLANRAGEVMDISWDGPPEFDATNPNEDEPTGICTDFPGLYTVTITSPCDSVAAYTFDVPAHECNTISGTAYLDYDEDCVYQTGDLGAANYLVTLTNEADGNSYTAYADADGIWSVSVPLGTYSITAVIPDGLPLLSCDPTTVTLGTDLVDEVYLGVRVIKDCAALRTEVTIPFLRRCFASSAFVAYHNAGTTLAPDATVTVDIDPFWIDVTTSVTPTSVDGTTYTFAVGDLPPFASGSIRFDFTVSCEAELGQAHCLEANISPQDFCNADDAWAGALVEIVDVVCDGDSIRFQIVNTGDNIMSVPLNYVVVEDGIMLSANPFVNGLLEADEAYEVSVAADGRTVSLSTNQEPFAPGAASPTVVLEGCNGAPNFSIGFTNLLPLNSGSPGSSLVCRENVGAYDPNDKRGYPLGWDGGNIQPGTRLDYEIRFQNTGTDTAFTVVIRDTLSAALDLSTFRMEAATHDYTVTIDTHRVITWTFNNIMLLDSFTSVPLSQGSVVFSIDHAAALQPGDEILNEAAIYFDFNEPVITNVSRHVIAAEGLPTSVRRVLARSVPLRVFPNPADDRIRLLVEETDLDNTDLVTVTDFLGRPLITLPATQAGGGVDVRTLPPGYYVLVLTDASGRAKGRAAFLVASR